MSSIERAWDFQRDLCEALGIDATKQRVYSVSIEAKANEPSYITIGRYLTEDEAEKVIKAVREHVVIEVDNNA